MSLFSNPSFSNQTLKVCDMRNRIKMDDKIP